MYLNDVIQRLERNVCQWGLFGEGFHITFDAELKQIIQDVTGNRFLIKLKGKQNRTLSIDRAVTYQEEDTDQYYKLKVCGEDQRTILIVGYMKAS